MESMTLEEAVRTLGDTHDTVARAIRSAGIIGRLHDVCHCPVARYLAQRMEIAEDRIAVGQHHITCLSDAGPEDLWGWKSVRTPHGVAHFIHEFDSGKHEDLIERELVPA